MTPRSNLYRQSDGTVVQIQMPGVPREAIDIQVVDGILRVKGKTPGLDKKLVPDVLRQEFDQEVEYRRDFRVADDIDAAGITAMLIDGILTLHIPDGKSAPAHKIPVT